MKVCKEIQYCWGKTSDCQMLLKKLLTKHSPSIDFFFFNFSFQMLSPRPFAAPPQIEAKYIWCSVLKLWHQHCFCTQSNLVRNLLCPQRYQPAWVCVQATLTNKGQNLAQVYLKKSVAIHGQSCDLGHSRWQDKRGNVYILLRKQNSTNRIKNEKL